MESHRINQLIKFSQEDPSDPFPKYALALEYQEQNPDKSKALFTELLNNYPEYTATYYHAADFFFRLEETDKARSIYEKGLELLANSSDVKAFHELQNAFQNFQFEVDY